MNVTGPNGYEDRLADFYVFVGDDLNFYNNPVCNENSVSYSGYVHCFLQGRYVTLRSSLYNYVNLIEFQVFTSDDESLFTYEPKEYEVGSVNVLQYATAN